MNLYSRDYNYVTPEEEQEYQTIRESEILKTPKGARRNKYPLYPIAKRHNLSLFPNNHIELAILKDETDIDALNEEFQLLIHNDKTIEQDILRFINHKPAYHIIASIFKAGGYTFGHHDAYLFPEFPLGDTYRADYLLVGKSSNGYEFVFIEFEKSNGRITLKDGHLGEAFRKGINQTKDWDFWLQSHFKDIVFPYFQKCTNKSELPSEFQLYDRTRFHYVVVAGLREDMDDKTRQLQRDSKQRDNTVLLHYDNLYDYSCTLQQYVTF